MMSVFGECDAYIVAITDINNGQCREHETQAVLSYDQRSSIETSGT